MKLSEIWVYPVKGLAGVSLTHATLERRGMALDRRWMVIDAQRRFLSQREKPIMALGKIEIRPDRLVLSAPGIDPLSLPFDLPALTRLSVRIWDDEVQAYAVSSIADEWFSQWLGETCRLVRMPESTIRAIPPAYQVHGDDHVSFADGYPFLLIAAASLQDLNSRLEAPVPMNRFRPNFVISDAPAFAEDTFHTFRIGQAVFRAVKPCARCTVTTIDQQAAQAGKEPLRTLARYRRAGQKVLFGQNLILLEGDTVALGDAVAIIDQKTPPFPLLTPS